MRRRLTLHCALATVAVLSSAIAGAAGTSAEAATSPAGSPSPQETDPELVALAKARRTGKPVEVAALLTETTRVVANPDGTLTAEVHAGPTRFKDAGGAWRNVNLTLEKRADGTVAPKSHPRGLVLAGASGDGDHDLARLQSGDAGLTLGWRGELPEPMLVGETATYPNVRKGIDLVIEVSRTGFEQLLVVKNRTAATGLKDIAMPWRTAGVTPQAGSDGGLTLRGSKGEYLGHVPPPRCGMRRWAPSRARSCGAPPSECLCGSRALMRRRSLSRRSKVSSMTQRRSIR